MTSRLEDMVILGPAYPGTGGKVSRAELAVRSTCDRWTQSNDLRRSVTAMLPGLG
jgi:hypothetical protein